MFLHLFKKIEIGHIEKSLSEKRKIITIHYTIEDNTCVVDLNGGEGALHLMSTTLSSFLLLWLFLME